MRTRQIIATVVLSAVVTFVFLSVAGAADPRARQGARPPAQAMAGEAGDQRLANRPASRPAAGVYPSAELVTACNAKADELRKKLSNDFTVIVNPPFVIAGNMDQAKLASHAKWSVDRPARAMWASYFKNRPSNVITVLLFSDEGAAPPASDKEVGYIYRYWARKLLNDTNVSYYGYYRPDIRTMVMNIDTGGGTLVHELTHALIVYDFADVPDWFNEGLGSLHEQCSVNEGEVVGLENWRLPALQKAIKARTLRSLKDLVTQNDFRGSQEGMNYAQARYFVMYMQHKGVLKDFYARYREYHRGDGAAVKAIEKVFGDKLANVEQDYKKWVLTLRFPPRER